jgi:hypothetical protein
MTRVILIGAAVVVAFDVAASLLLRSLDASLLFMFLGEGLIYLTAGFVGGRIGGLAGGVRAGASVAALDCAVGWPITWALGTGQVSRLTLASAAFVLVAMIATGAVAGAVGAVGARALPRR